MAQPSLLAKPPELPTAQSAVSPVTAPVAQPVIAREVQPLNETLKTPVQPGANPVAEVQAKLRAALTDAPAKPSLATDIFFKTMMAVSCVGTTLVGLAIGVACVFLGTAIYLFPVTAGLSLAAVVISSGYLAYRMYTGSPKEAATRRASAKAGDMFEPLAAGRFNVAGVA
ncbi:MAG: hypothetical protein ABWZ40_14550 [Caulobacterales bacterium]